MNEFEMANKLRELEQAKIDIASLQTRMNAYDRILKANPGLLQILTNGKITGNLEIASLSGAGFKDEDNMASNSDAAAASQQSIVAYIASLILDEDNFASNSDTKVPTQQSVKAYGDANWASGTWTDYTPTWTSDGTQPGIGNGTLYGKYSVIGNTCHLSFYLFVGSTTTFGSGTYFFSLPLAVGSGIRHVGNCAVYDSSTGLYYLSYVNLLPGESVMWAFLKNGSSNTVFSPNQPITWASGDQIRLSVTYQT